MTNPMDGALMHISHIFHPTDFSPASMEAFGHALKLSLTWKARAITKTGEIGLPAAGGYWGVEALGIIHEGAYE